MYTVRGIAVAAIQIFENYVLVQETESGKIYTVGFDEFDTKTESDEDSTNIVSMEGYKQWQEEKNLKTQFKKDRIKVRKKQHLRLIAL